MATRVRQHDYSACREMRCDIVWERLAWRMKVSKKKAVRYYPETPEYDRLVNADGEIKNYRQAFPLLLKAAREGNYHAQNLVGYCYSNGIGTTRNDKIATAWFAKAAKQNHIVAIGNLALHYEQGEGIKRDLRAAARFYLKAALKGLPWAQCNLGIMYSDGIG